MVDQLNAPLRTPIQNDHFGYEFLERDARGRFHPGEDMNGPGAGSADQGMPVYAIGPGVVTFVDIVGPNLGWGKICYTKHDMEQYFLSFGVDRPDWCPEMIWSQYAHMQDVEVTEGQEVDQNTIIGPLGGTPYWSPHLHWEIRKRPLGVYYYPSTRVTEDQMHEMYFAPTKFVDRVNIYILMERSKQRPTSRLIKSEKQPEVYVYNGKSRFHIPNEQTALLLFGPDWIDEVEEVGTKQLKAIKEDEPLPDMKP
jgi:murein DD-endopeptidase MepM/ murein hydrolase activator NlpD